MFCAEDYAFEGMTVMAGMLGVLELGSQSICFLWTQVIYQFPLGISEAVCGLVGNCIGSNNVPLAERFFSITFKITLFINGMIVLGTILARSYIVSIFTDD